MEVDAPLQLYCRAERKSSHGLRADAYLEFAGGSGSGRPGSSAGRGAD